MSTPNYWDQEEETETEEEFLATSAKKSSYKVSGNPLKITRTKEEIYKPDKSFSSKK